MRTCLGRIIAERGSHRHQPSVIRPVREPQRSIVSMAEEQGFVPASTEENIRAATAHMVANGDEVDLVGLRVFRLDNTVSLCRPEASNMIMLENYDRGLCLVNLECSSHGFTSFAHSGAAHACARLG